jgi:hypothetical protein
MDECDKFGLPSELHWELDFKEECRSIVERRMKKAGKKRVLERSDLYRLAECCVKLNCSNKVLGQFTLFDWCFGYQYPDQVAYTSEVVARIVDMPLMSASETAHELHKAYTKMLVEREIVKRLRKSRLNKG